MIGKIKRNIQGLNLAFKKGPKEELLSIAKDIFPDFRFEEVTLFDNCYCCLTWNHNLKDLFEQDNSLGKEERFSLVVEIEDPIMRMHQILDFIESLLKKEEVDYAYMVLERLGEIDLNSERMPDPRSLGYRKFLEYYAQKADRDNFLKTLKLTEPGKQKNEIERLKSLFVQEYAGKNELADSLELLKNKAFGDKYLYHVFAPIINKISYRKMKTLLETTEALQTMPENDRLTILAQTFADDAKTDFSVADFEELFGQIEVLDPEIKAGDVRLRDFLLLQLGMNLNDLEYVAKCKKAMNNNILKKELTLVENNLKRGKAANNGQLTSVPGKNTR